MLYISKQPNKKRQQIKTETQQAKQNREQLSDLNGAQNASHDKIVCWQQFVFFGLDMWSKKRLTVKPKADQAAVGEIFILVLWSLSTYSVVLCQAMIDRSQHYNIKAKTGLAP